MKAIGLSIVMFAVTAAAQSTPPKPPPAPAQPPVPVEPKHSEATTSLDLFEEKILNGQIRRGIIVQSANAQIQQLNASEAELQKGAASEEEIIKKENGWGEDVQYVAPQQQQDGNVIPGRWQKQPKK
jgi:hypothetical protein